jgi:succinoglycan biosynthesis transport protein ExoP
MAQAKFSPGGRRSAAEIGGTQISPEHYLRLIWHRKWLVLITCVVVSAGTFVYSYRLRDRFRSETLILVDPQKVPDAYVKATVTGDIRNRLGTLSQQILSATRLQKIIDNLNLYPAERKTLVREDILAAMRKDISVNVVSDFGGSQDLQAFRITYTGYEPRLVAQVANELATQFIDENMKAREQQASGTNEFLQSQLQHSRTALEAQESKLRDFRLKHIGEMPEQQSADLQIMGQLRSQLQLEGEGLARAEQQKTYFQSMLTQNSAPVVDLDDSSPKVAESTVKQQAKSGSPAPAQTKLDQLKAKLASLQGRYWDQHPEVRKAKQEITDEEKRLKAAETVSAEERPAAVTAEAPTPATVPVARREQSYASNPVIQSQLKTVEEEIAKHKQEQQRLNKLASEYQAKLEAIPVREQEIADLVRDYEISKAHYQQLLNSQLSAETATQLEIRQKGEKFSILDHAQPAEKPTSPNRQMINAGGFLAGLALGLALALATEFLGMSITVQEQLEQATGAAVLEVIPVIQTQADRRMQKKRLVLATVCCLVITILGSGAALFYHYRT